MQDNERLTRFFFENHSYNRYIAVASRALRRSLKEDKRILAERRGESADIKFAKWSVSDYNLFFGSYVSIRERPIQRRGGRWPAIVRQEGEAKGGSGCATDPSQNEKPSQRQSTDHILFQTTERQGWRDHHPQLRQRCCRRRERHLRSLFLSESTTRCARNSW